jgi:hypothetical protein
VTRLRRRLTQTRFCGIGRTETRLHEKRFGEKYIVRHKITRTRERAATCPLYELESQCLVQFGDVL